ncbi:MAG: FHIPEP family type III secretion protein [Comamonadaceae bacterium]|nr:FHIPEP family type III secretion protein [Comamonadaceae bacterium]
MFGTPAGAGRHRPAIIGMLGLIPGMPNLAFLMLAGGVGGAGLALHRRQQAARPQRQRGRRRQAPRRAPTPEAELGRRDRRSTPLGPGGRLPADPAGGSQTQDGELLGRIKGVRKKLAQELGFLVPPVHIRDNLDLAPNAYRITLLGVTGGRSRVHSRPASWPSIRARSIGTAAGHRRPRTRPSVCRRCGSSPDQREQAQTLGYTVVDASTVIATHLNQVLHGPRARAAGPRGGPAAAGSRWPSSAPKLVEDLVPKTAAAAGRGTRCCRTCWPSRCRSGTCAPSPKRLAEHGPRSQDPDVLTAAVTRRLGPDDYSKYQRDGRRTARHHPGSGDLEQILLRTSQMGWRRAGPWNPGWPNACTKRCWKPPRNRSWWVNRRYCWFRTRSASCWRASCGTGYPTSMSSPSAKFPRTRNSRSSPQWVSKRNQTRLAPDAEVATTAGINIMKIKRLSAADIREAMRKIREELGPDAVILSNQRSAAGFEIIAAVDYDEAAAGHATAGDRSGRSGRARARETGAPPTPGRNSDSGADGEPAGGFRRPAHPRPSRRFKPRRRQLPIQPRPRDPTAAATSSGRRIRPGRDASRTPDHAQPAGAAAGGFGLGRAGTTAASPGRTAEPIAGLRLQPQPVPATGRRRRWRARSWPGVAAGAGNPGTRLVGHSGRYFEPGRRCRPDRPDRSRQDHHHRQAGGALQRCATACIAWL